MKFRIDAKTKLQEITHNSVGLGEGNRAHARYSAFSQPRTYLPSGRIFFKSKAHLLPLNDGYYNYFSDTHIIDKYFRFTVICFADIEIFLEKKKRVAPLK